MWGYSMFCTPSHPWRQTNVIILFTIFGFNERKYMSFRDLKKEKCITWGIYTRSFNNPDDSTLTEKQVFGSMDIKR